MKSTLLIELHHAPLLFYFDLIKQYPNLLLEVREEFPKQTLRNRTYILTSNKVQMLTVPVIKENKGTSKDVKIDYSQTWLRDHTRAITSAYKHAPYFDYCFPYYEEIYNKRYPFLFDLNLEILQLSLRILKLRVNVGFTEFYLRENTNDTIADVRNLHQNESPESTTYSPYRYAQLFGSKFITNLSIFDFIFNNGF